MSRSHEVSVRFSHPLRGGVRADLAMPLPASPPPTPPAPPPPPPAPPPAPAADPQAQAQALQQEVHTALVALNAAAAQLAGWQAQHLAEMRQAAVELAAALAGRLLRERVRTDQFPLEPMAREVVGRLPVRHGVVVHLNPADLAVLGRNEDRAAADPGVRFAADPALARGCCRAEAAGATVLSDWEWQLAQLRQELVEGVRDARPGPG